MEPLIDSWVAADGLNAGTTPSQRGLKTLSLFFRVFGFFIFGRNDDGSNRPLAVLVTRPAGEVVKVYHGHGDAENRIKEGKNLLRWDKTSCHRSAANQGRLLVRVLAYNLLHMPKQFYLMGEAVKRAMEWLIERLIKVREKASYQGRRWYVHVASAFPLASHCRAPFG
jgi:hypothetical protein